MSTPVNLSPIRASNYYKCRAFVTQYSCNVEITSSQYMLTSRQRQGKIQQGRNKSKRNEDQDPSRSPDVSPISRTVGPDTSKKYCLCILDYFLIECVVNKANQNLSPR